MCRLEKSVLVFPFSVVNRFGYSFESGNISSINLKKEHIFGSVHFRFRIGSLLNGSTSKIKMRIEEDGSLAEEMVEVEGLKQCSMRWRMFSLEFWLWKL